MEYFSVPFATLFVPLVLLAGAILLHEWRRRADSLVMLIGKVISFSAALWQTFVILGATAGGGGSEMLATGAIARGVVTFAGSIVFAVGFVMLAFNMRQHA